MRPASRLPLAVLAAAVIGCKPTAEPPSPLAEAGVDDQKLAAFAKDDPHGFDTATAWASKLPLLTLVVQADGSIQQGEM